MSFRIVVTEIREVPNTKREHHRVSETGNERDDGPIWAYVEVGGVQEEEREVFRQELDQIDLFKIIQAVNVVTS